MPVLSVYSLEPTPGPKLVVTSSQGKISSWNRMPRYQPLRNTTINNVEDYIWTKKLLDRYGKKGPRINFSYKEWGWGLEHRARNPDIQHKSEKKKKARCGHCTLWAHKLRRPHVKYFLPKICSEFPCPDCRRVNRIVCYTCYNRCPLRLLRKL